MAHTITETGFPGSPKTGTPCSLPNITGFPGLIATFQKSTFRPWALRALRTKSCSPTDMPPEVTNKSAPLAPLAIACSTSLWSGAIPRLMDFPPQASTNAAKPNAFELTIWLGPIGSPGRTISSPVAKMAIRGFRWTESQG